MKNKKFLLVMLSILIFSTAFSNMNTVSASTISEPPNKPEETEVINTEYFSPTNSSKFISEPYANDPGYGASKISDSLSTLNGLRDAKNRSFTSMATFKGAAIEIASNIPGIGKWVETGNTIWVHLKNVMSDIGSGTGKDVKITTTYSDRYFYHWLYVYDYNNTWKDMGWSISRYWYKNIVVQYLDTVNDRVRTVAYDFSRNQNNPNAISKAPNYMNKTRLSAIIIDKWRRNQGKHTESY